MANADADRADRARGAPIVRKNTVRLAARHRAPRPRRASVGVSRGARPAAAVARARHVDRSRRRRRRVRRSRRSTTPTSTIALRVFVRQPGRRDRRQAGPRARARGDRAAQARASMLDGSAACGSSTPSPTGCRASSSSATATTSSSSSTRARSPTCATTLYDALDAELAPKAIYEQRRYRSLGGEAPRQAGADLVRGDAGAGRARGQRGRSDVRRRRHRAAVDRAVRRSARGPARGAPVGEGSPRAESVLVHRRDLGLRAGRRRDRDLRGRRRREGARARAPQLRGVGLRSREAGARRRRRVQGARAVRRARAARSISSSLDPPAFASAAARGGKPWSAIRDYAELVTASLEVTAPGGLLVAASSTHKMSPAEFEHRARRRCAGGAARGCRSSIAARCRRTSRRVPGIPRGELPEVRRRRSRLSESSKQFAWSDGGRERVRELGAGAGVATPTGDESKPRGAGLCRGVWLGALRLDG